MLNPGSYSFNARTNTTFTLPLTYTDTNGDVVNLSAYSARLQMRAIGTDSVAYELNTANGGITLAATAPNITWSLSVTTINTIALGGYDYDFVLYSGAGYTGTQTALLAGIATITPGITE